MDGNAIRARLERDSKLVLLLPHEHREVARRMAELALENAQLAESTADAVGQSDWHDNPAYDFCVTEMKRLDSVSRSLGPLIANGEMVDYPEEDEPTVTLGSRVQVKTGPDIFIADIVGQSVFVDPMTHPEDVELVSVGSPIGRAILGRLPDEPFGYTVGDGRILEAIVVSIDQRAVAAAHS